VAVELGKLKDERTTDALMRRLSDRDKTVRSRAADALGEIGDTKAIPRILKTLKDTHIDIAFRVSAALALAQMGQDEGPKFILGLVKSTNPDDRVIAAETLGGNQIEGRSEPLLSLLADSVERVRFAAVQAVRELHDPRAIPALKKLLDDPEPAIREHAAIALEELGVKPQPASHPGKP
jgi:HEAT repeat protein